MVRTHRLSLLALAVALGLAVAGCGSDEPASTSGADSHNAADIDFASEMVPHHEQALLMVDMTEGRDLSPEFEQLTQDIEAAQTPEIEQMQGWLADWGVDVPSGSTGHMMGGSGGSGMGGAMGPGMMSDRDLTDLRGAGSDAFEDMWLRMMIAHHEGAIEMAQTEVADGEYGAALDLARSIASSQQVQITQMQSMLSD